MSNLEDAAKRAERMSEDFRDTTMAMIQGSRGKEKNYQIHALARELFVQSVSSPYPMSELMEYEYVRQLTASCFRLAEQYLNHASEYPPTSDHIYVAKAKETLDKVYVGIDKNNDNWCSLSNLIMLLKRDCLVPDELVVTPNE